MRQIFKCSSCRRDFEITELLFLPGQDIFDTHSGLHFNSGNRVCYACYSEKTEGAAEIAKQIEKESERSAAELSGIISSNRFQAPDKIGKLAVGQNNVKLLVTVMFKTEDKVVFNEKGEKLRIAKFKVRDDTGNILLALWNNIRSNIIDSVKPEDIIYIDDGYVQEWNGQPQITLGVLGKLRKINE